MAHWDFRNRYFKGWQVELRTLEVTASTPSRCKIKQKSIPLPWIEPTIPLSQNGRSYLGLSLQTSMCNFYSAVAIELHNHSWWLICVCLRSVCLKCFLSDNYEFWVDIMTHYRGDEYRAIHQETQVSYITSIYFSLHFYRKGDSDNVVTQGSKI